MREDEAARYIRTLCAELVQRKDYLEGAFVSTIYFGGGTPSRLTPKQIGHVKDCIEGTYGLDSLEEFTVECNPDDVNYGYVSALRSIGVNRISMGVQTFNDDMLRFLGRRHTASQSVTAVDVCHRSGIDNVSIDLMYGLPGQAITAYQQDLEMATSLDVQHISSYCLSYEAGSQLERLRNDNRVIPADDDTCAAMYDRMCAHLHKAGFVHYEISNFCKPGYHSRHNGSYWDGTPYLGVGAGAHSYNCRSRQWNPDDLDAYMDGMEKGCLKPETEHLTTVDLYNERLMLRLRTLQGLNLSSLSSIDRLSVLQTSDKLISNGSLVLDNNCLRIPESRMFISDSIISSLFL